MLDYDYAEEQALKEAEKYAYKATENVPAKQQKEAYNQIKGRNPTDEGAGFCTRNGGGLNMWKNG